MKTLSEYIAAAFTASLIAGIGERIAPKGMKKYVTFIASLMLLIFLFTPIKALGEDLFGFASDVTENERLDSSNTDSYDEILKITKKKTEEAIQKHLVEKFSIQNGVEISLTMEMKENETILLTHIMLKISHKDTELASELENYLEKTFNTETSVNLL